MIGLGRCLVWCWSSQFGFSVYALSLKPVWNLCFWAIVCFVFWIGSVNGRFWVYKCILCFEQNHCISISSRVCISSKVHKTLVFAMWWYNGLKLHVLGCWCIVIWWVFSVLYWEDKLVTAAVPDPKWIDMKTTMVNLLFYTYVAINECFM